MVKEFQFESQTTYTFMEELGRGGMGIVYLAQRNSGGVVDYVVLKTLKSLTKEDETSLRQEANLAALLRHENVVKTYGLESIPLLSLPETFLQELGALSYVNEAKRSNNLRRLNFKINKGREASRIAQSAKQVDDKQLLLIVMDYIDGINLKALHYEHTFQSLLIPVPMGAFIISRVARALAYAHHYIIHRDVSPENILVNTQGICKLSDFGIAVTANQQPDYWAGKLSYMAPEQIYNQAIDERVDIFSLGSVAYQIITGIPLIEVVPDLEFEQQVEAVKKQFQTGFPEPASIRRDVSEELSQIIMKMIAPAPHKRYQRASEIANELEKKYLYAKGYGPTNNSLSTYLNVFENRFSNYHEDQLQQLSFLKNEKAEIQLKRPLQISDYTEVGMKMLESRKNSEIYKRLRATSHLRQIQVSGREEKKPYLKLKHLDNVIEAFPISNNFTIGQSEKMALRLCEKGLLPHHCTLAVQENNVFIKVATPGALVGVNGIQAQERELKDGDKIKIGSYLMFFINQKPMEPSPATPITLAEGTDLTAAPFTGKDLLIQFTPRTALTQLARLADQLLSTTDLSELKLGIIPTALVESLQLLKGQDDDQPFRMRIIRKSIFITFQCLNLGEAGYNAFLDTLKKHRALLAKELEEKEKIQEEKDSKKMDLFGADDSRSSPRKSPVASPAAADIDMEDFDPSKLAAQLIVHAFDRIELLKDKKEVELVVYLS